MLSKLLLLLFHDVLQDHPLLEEPPSEREQQKKKELKERTKGSKPNKGQGRGAARGRGGKRDGGDISQPDRKFPRVSAVTASPALHQPTSAAPIITQEKSEGVASASLRRPSSDSASVGTHASARTSGLNVVDKYLQELDIAKILSGQSLGDKAYHCKRALNGLIEKNGETTEVVTLRAHYNMAQLALELL